MTVSSVSPLEIKAKLLSHPELFLLDVREPDEFEFAKITGSVLIPMNTIPERCHELDPNQEIVVICHHGVRSMQVAKYLSEHGFHQVVNLTGGIDAWSRDCDSQVPRY